MISFVLLLSDSLVSGWTVFLDAPIRISSTTTNLETYSFWWTTLLYLAPFFFLLLLIAIGLFYKYRIRYSFNTLIVFFFLYLFEIVDYIPLNFTDALTTYTEYGSNILLTNSLNKYHPFVFYTSTVLFFVTTTLTITSRPETRPFQWGHSLKISRIVGWWAIQFNLIALFMGGWWALQEGTWGGWWNWDSSETLGLEISLFSLALLHPFISISSLKFFTVQSWIFLFFFIATYFFIQLNFELVSHNFGSKFFFFFNNNLFSMEIIFFTVFGLFWLARFNSLSSINRALSSRSLLRTTNVTTGRIFFVKLLPHLIAISWFFWSYKPLLNYFVWNFFGLNLFNYENSIQPYNAILFLLLFGWIFSFTPQSRLISSTLTVLLGNWMWLLPTFISQNSRLTFLHYLLIVFSILNLGLIDAYFISWFPSPLYLATSPAPVPIWPSNELLTVDVNSWECVNAYVSLTERCQESWNLITFSNIPNINFFFLNFSQNLCSNHYDLGFSYLRIYLKIELFGIPTLMVTFVVGILILTFLRKRVKEIHF